MFGEVHASTLSRLKQGFESPRGRQFVHSPTGEPADFLAVYARRPVM
jgi:hypothetical protein